MYPAVTYALAKQLDANKTINAMVARDDCLRWSNKYQKLEPFHPDNIGWKIRKFENLNYKLEIFWSGNYDPDTFQQYNGYNYNTNLKELRHRLGQMFGLESPEAKLGLLIHSLEYEYQGILNIIPILEYWGIDESLKRNETGQQNTLRIRNSLCLTIKYGICSDERLSMIDDILKGNLDPSICINGSSWCHNCTQDCSDFDDGLFMKFMFMKWAYDRYQSPLRLMQFIFNGIFQNKCFWRAELLPIQEHRTFLKDNDITEIIDAWNIIEGHLDSNQSSDYLKSLFHDCASPICTKPDLDKIIDDLDQPKIHGNLINDFVLVPLCSFGTPNLEPCTSFKPSEFTYKDEKCFTFNNDQTNAYYSNNR